MTIKQVRCFKLGCPTQIVSFSYDFVQRFILNVKILLFSGYILIVFTHVGYFVFWLNEQTALLDWRTNPCQLWLISMLFWLWIRLVVGFFALIFTDYANISTTVYWLHRHLCFFVFVRIMFVICESLVFFLKLKIDIISLKEIICLLDRECRFYCNIILF